MFICISTFKGYEIALNRLLESLPADFNNLIIVYSGCPEEERGVTRNEKGRIIVKIPNNIYEYGNFIGVHMAFEAGMLDEDERVVMLHDTCKLRDKSIGHIMDLITKYPDEDIVFFSKSGQANLCMINKTAAQYGYNVYNDVMTVPKMTAIEWEWAKEGKYAPNAFPLRKTFINENPQNIASSAKVYSDVARCCVVFPCVQIEKYYQFVRKEGEHAQRP